ncbi:MAG: hypothetical protein ACI9W2_002913 [Gammaproteobacteria bacterium]|jgi:hypothetical protein
MCRTPKPLADPRNLSHGLVPGSDVCRRKVLVPGGPTSFAKAADQRSADSGMRWLPSNVTSSGTSGKRKVPQPSSQHAAPHRRTTSSMEQGSGSCNRPPPMASRGNFARYSSTCRSSASGFQAARQQGYARLDSEFRDSSGDTLLNSNFIR